MKVPLFSMRDVKAGAFSPPECAVNEDVARRTFDMRLHNDRSMGFSPSDYDLFCVGTFDGDTGVIESHLPEFIVNGGELF